MVNHAKELEKSYLQLMGYATDYAKEICLARVLFGLRRTSLWWTRPP